jgi:hypothetical protein
MQGDKLHGRPRKRIERARRLLVACLAAVIALAQPSAVLAMTLAEPSMESVMISKMAGPCCPDYDNCDAQTLHDCASCCGTVAALATCKAPIEDMGRAGAADIFSAFLSVRPASDDPPPIPII